MSSKRTSNRLVNRKTWFTYQVHLKIRYQSFKNIFGYHPILLHIHNTGELLDIIFRPGAEFTSTGADDILRDNITRLKPYFDEIILLADAGFYEKSIIEICEEKNISFIITSELNAPIKRKLSDTNLAWKEPLAPTEENSSEIKHRDSHTLNYRLQSLKKALEKNGKALKIRGELQIAEFNHTVAAWKKTTVLFINVKKLLNTMFRNKKTYLVILKNIFIMDTQLIFMINLLNK